MDRMISNARKRERERGQTIVLVAIALLALLSMAALAIDVVTLYVARSEAQRAANAAAIAGAKIIATSGFTSVQGGGAISQADACNAAIAATQPFISVIPVNPGSTGNTVAGQAPTAAVTCNFAVPQNPQVTVVVNRTGLPTFFARIWSRAANSISATATAEAYNPSGQSVPIQVSIKPWFIPNCDVSHTTPNNPNYCGGNYAPFVNTAISPQDGSITNNGSFIGNTITISKVPNASNLTLCAGGCTPPCPPGACNTQYYPLNIPETPAPVCPSPSAISCTSACAGDTYFDNIASASQYQISCGQRIGRGEIVDVDNNNNDSVDPVATEATQCLIHTNSTGTPPSPSQQDAFTATVPTVITGGTENPNLNLRTIQNISRSDSIVTVPLYDGVGGGTPLNLCRPGRFCNRSAVVVGFLQLAIVESNPPPAAQNGSFQAIIVNVAGCNPSAAGNPVSGGGVSPVPVRLINQ